MNLGEMLQELYDVFGGNDGIAPHPRAVNRFTRFLNSEYRTLMSEKGMDKCRRGVLTFSTIAGIDTCVLPLVCSDIFIVVDRTNQRELDLLTLRDLRDADPGVLSSASTPQGYVIENYAAPLARDPSAAAELFVKSTNAADAGGVHAFLDGYITGGYPTRKNTTLNGVTAMTFDALTTTWLGARKFYLSSVCQGDIIINQGSGAGTELARIPAGRTFSRYTRLIIYPVPSSVVTLHADVELAIDNLEQETDEPIFHEDFHPLLPALAEAREWTRKEKPIQAGTALARARKIKGDLKLKLARGGSALSRRSAYRFSQLGPYFPAGT